ncbi:ATP-dependent metallopeptidase FtsH/Yme1/Tma family protein [Candidatus Peregrinibacteria bacterium]|nr:ATP-dependent metallopeptidase FtsH/Yme1/Tma family protein [Candidatus Peregrinibacteria bacterium]
MTEKKPSNLFYLGIAAIVLTALYIFFGTQEAPAEKVNLTTFQDAVKNEQIKSVEVKGNKIFFTLEKGEKKFAIKESDDTITDILSSIPQEKRDKLEIEITDTEGSSMWINILANLIPVLLIVGFFIFLFRQAQNSNNQALSFGKSGARLQEKDSKKNTFADVAGAKEAKEELIEIVDFLKNPLKYTSIGAKIPKGVLLIGPPGCGKTLLARAVAGEADVPFFNISGSEFVEMFVGVGASRVRDLFKKAKRNAPCIVFIDEIDAVGRQRGAGLGGGHDEREQTLNQILTEMDGFEKDTNIIVMAATNRPDVLDPALLRPGRFDRRIVVDIPDIAERTEILKVHTRGKPLDKNVDLTNIGRQTPGFSGADLENLLNEATILTAKKNQKTVTHENIEQSIEKVMMGPERKSRVLSKKEKEITAFHEVGHALVAHKLPNCDPVHKISIVSRGMALGATWTIPEEDKHLYSKSKFEDELCSLLGGHIAEKLIFGEVTTGASNDLERASKIARKMVTEYGMSTLGPIIYGERSHEIFLGRDFMHSKNYSEEMAAKIDQEIKTIISTAYGRTEDILKKNLEKLREITQSLLKKETLSRKEFLEFFEKTHGAKRSA